MFGTILHNQWLMLLALGIILFGVAETGYRIGLNLHARKDEARRSQIAGVQGAVLGMLALLLGFTFAMPATVARLES